MTSEEKTTRQVAEELTVQHATLQLWVREGYIHPRVTGEGRQRRMAWRVVDVERARRLRDRNGTTPLIATFGPELHAAAIEAWRLRDFRGEGDMIVAGPERGRIARQDATLREAVARVAGEFLVVLK